MGGIEPARRTLSPTMASHKVAVFDFVADYLEQHHGMSPSLEEIRAGAGLNSRQHAKKLRDALVQDGRLVVVPGKARSVALPSTIDAAVAELRRRGMVVDGDFLRASYRRATGMGDDLRTIFPLTFSTLPELPPGFDIAGGDRAAGEGGDGAGPG